jgi:hypothetical protein
MRRLPPSYIWLAAAWPIIVAICSLGSAQEAIQSQEPRTYVVSPAGDDRQPGTSKLPWRTLGHATAQVRPGDTVLVRAGEYSAGAVLRRSGEDGRPIILRNFPGERPVINGHGQSRYGLVLDGLRFVRVQGFEIREIRTPNPRHPDVLHEQGGILLRESSDCVIAGNRIVTGGLPGYGEEHPGATGIQLWSRKGRGCHRNLILGNEVSQSAYGIHLRGPAQHNVIEGNWLHDNQELKDHSDGFKCESIDYDRNHPRPFVDSYLELAGDGWAAHTPRENVLRYNLCENNSDDGIDTWISIGNLVEFNLASGSGMGKPGDGNGFKLGPGGRNFVRLNLSRDNRMNAYTNNGGLKNVYEHNLALGNSGSGIADGVLVLSGQSNDLAAERWQRREAEIRRFQASLRDHPPLEIDLLVYDSTPAGIIAAIAAARAGMRVVLLSEDRNVGGMQTSGLGNTNAGQRATVGGLTREFHERVHRYYVEQYGADSPQVRVCQDGFRFEPHVALAVYNAWLAESGVRCLMQEAAVAVRKSAARLLSVETDRGREIRARTFIDASYEGDLLKLAGCSYRVGREGSGEYGESLAGVRFPPEAEGQPDKKIQPFDYRLCLTDVAANRVSFQQPPDYDPVLFAWHAAQLRHKPPRTLRELLPLNPMPSGKTDSRTGEWIGASWDYPEASSAQRLLIAARHRQYAQAYLWFLLTDEAVPGHLRRELSGWGYAQDEFADNGHWPDHIYVRQARRLVGDYVMTQSDVTEHRFKPDGVALGSYYLDVHPVQLVPDEGAVGGLRAEGGLGKLRVQPYEIPYRSLLPQRTEAENLLVPVCLSASHVAYSTIRMEPVYMMLGHACGTAAALAQENSTPLHGLSTATLRERLRADGQIFDARPFTQVWP